MREKRVKRQGTEATKGTEATPALVTGSRERRAKAWMLASLWSLLSLASLPLTAATGASPEFRLDLRGLGPWQRHTARASEPLAFSSSWATNVAAGAKAVVKVMPVLKTKPKYLVIDLSGGTSATHYPITSLDEVPGGSWGDEYKTSKLVLRHIPAGSFIMGGRATDYPGAVNTNLHMVTITRDFYMGVFEVTQRQWELVMGTRPSSFTNEAAYATRPVETVSYIDARGPKNGLDWPSTFAVDEDSFMGKLRRLAGLDGIDLPTEAQWEFACRAGTTTALYTGKNITMVNKEDAALSEIARYTFNGGGQWANSSYKVSTQEGTSVVGCYIPNSCGLYDCFGNVWEMMLNHDTDYRGVDPVGVNSSLYRMVCGGSWVNLPQRCLDHALDTDCGLQIRRAHIGFRLCLQGGDVPDFAAASTLVNESGTGSQSWTPTRSGAYYLTHSTMNGTTNVQLQSAWFEVPGCELTIEPQGELTNGVSVAITGAGEGWTLYYTTNGLAPSAASEKYTGPFSLPESATVRAVAYNTQGVASEETTTSFTLHDALSVVGAVARPRYPWNGLVDVDCEIKGDPEAKYDVELVVKDLEGGTNLTVRTVYVDAMVPIASEKDGSIPSDAIGTIASTLAPGRHRLTWNADTDIAYDHDFPRVAVTVRATKQSVLAGYARQFAISTDGYAGEETLTGVPVLVRLSTAIDGFNYRDFASPSNGADLAFFDANEQALPYEIDEWHTNGESLVWVKLPTLKKGTRFVCAYGNVDAESSPRQKEDVSNSIGRGGDTASTGRTCMKHEVWRDYAGVWHMNEDSGTAFDSTEHGLDALPSCGTNKLADISQMVAGIGVCGKSRVNSLTEIPYGNYMEVPSYDGLSLGSTFVCSGWFKTFAFPKYHARLVRRKYYDWKSADGWEIELNPNYPADGRGASEKSVYFAPSETFTNWCHMVALYQGDHLQFYTNGVACTPLAGYYASETIAPATDNAKSLRFGDSIGGQYDEIRLRGGSLSADRIKADYDMIANRAFCTYGAVKDGTGAKITSPKPADATGDLIGITGDVLIIDVSAGSTATSYPISELNGVDIGSFNCDVYKTDKIVLRKVPVGSYYCQPRGWDAADAVATQKLTTKGFYIGVFPVTQRQYERVMGTNPSYYQSDAVGNVAAQRPVELVSWNTIRGSVAVGTAITATSADSFLQRIVARTGLSGFDLPTEAQWEMACRANATAAYGAYWSGSAAVELTSATIGEAAWYWDNSSSTTHAVGGKRPNLWGLYDMQGNVWEWCRDIYVSTFSTACVDTPCTDTSYESGECRVLQGGSWRNGALSCRPSGRNGVVDAGYCYHYDGFRLLRNLP